MSRSLVDKVIRLCESRGFSVESRFESSLGTACSYQFGPLGTELRRNLVHAWWYDVVISKGNVYGFEATNKLITQAPDQTSRTSETTAHLSENATALTQLFTVIPGIKLPFGAAWNRKYFRKPENDNYILRSWEREVMTLQYFCAENKVNDWTTHWKRQRLVWWRKFANVRSNFSLNEEQTDLEPGVNNQTSIQDHLCKAASCPVTESGHLIEVQLYFVKFPYVDLLQYTFPWGKESVDTITVSSDLHKYMTNEDCSRLPFNKESMPCVIQINTDINTGFLAFLVDAYQEKERSDSSGNVSLRTVLHLHPQLAPVKVAVLSQLPEQNELCEIAQQLSSELREAAISTQCFLYASADVCYAYQDEIGTPYCITVLESTLTNGIVMLRSRNTTLQEYMHVSDILSTVKSHLG